MKTTISLLLAVTLTSSAGYLEAILAPYVYARARMHHDTSQWTVAMYDHYLAHQYPEPSHTKEIFDEAIDTLESFDSATSTLDHVHQSALLLLKEHTQPDPRLMHYTSPQMFIDSFPKAYTDAMAYEYVKLNKQSFIAVIFPRAKQESSHIITQLQKKFPTVYIKKLAIHPKKASRFIRTLYGSESWLGNVHTNYSGAREKAHLCYGTSTTTAPTYVVLFSSTSLDEVVHAKKNIRKTLKAHNHALHINDTHHEALRIAQTVFNDQSIHFINHAGEKSYDNFNRYFTRYKQLLASSSVDSHTLCIDSSAVLSCYGLRDCKDLDFLHHGTIKDVASLCAQDIQSHNQEATYYPVSIDTIIFDPHYHFYVDGLKFASLAVTKKMKQRRNEPKDRRDCLLIDSLLS